MRDRRECFIEFTISEGHASLTDCVTTGGVMKAIRALQSLPEVFGFLFGRGGISGHDPGSGAVSHCVIVRPILASHW